MNISQKCNRRDHALEGERYLKKHDLDIYLEDAVKQMLRCKQLDGGGKIVDPATFLHKYFISVKIGDHILLRDFSYIKATPWNRLAFLTKFQHAFQHLSTDSFSWNDFHSLLCLLCLDFSKDVVQRAVKTASCQTDERLEVSFTDFFACLHVEFYYLEFSRKVESIFQEMSLEQNTQGEFKLPSKSIFKRIKEQIYNESVIFAPPMPLIEDICRNGFGLQYRDLILSLSSKLKICLDH